MTPEKPTKSFLNENCKKAGVDDPEYILYQVIHLKGEPSKNEQSIDIIATNMKFSTIQLNAKFNVTMLHPRRRTSQQTYDKNCLYLLEFSCATD